MDLEKLEKLAELKEKGILTDEEFDIEKNKALAENEPASDKDGTTIIHIYKDNDSQTKSSQSPTIAFILCLFFGWLGFHRFYTGSVFLGFLYFLTGGILGIGVLLDLIWLLCGTYKNGRGEYL